jgi:hypothetical protein
LDQKSTVTSLLEKAAKYKDFARRIGDSETAQSILALTEELKQRARALMKPSEGLVRKRAQELWEQAGRPEGRDKEFWLQAENELEKADDEPPTDQTLD